MTLSAFLGKDHTVINEREHISFHPPWKNDGSKTKDTQSALSALTLLAFLFFLNILQSCLRDSLQSQAPITIMMTTTTTTTETEGQRNKRSNDEVNENRKSLYHNEDFQDDARFKKINNIDQTKMTTWKEISLANYNNFNDYNIFILEDNTIFNNSPKDKKNEEHKTTKMKDPSSIFSNLMYNKACCLSESKYKKSEKKNSKEYFRKDVYSSDYEQ